MFPALPLIAQSAHEPENQRQRSSDSNSGRQLNVFSRQTATFERTAEVLPTRRCMSEKTQFLLAI